MPKSLKPSTLSKVRLVFNGAEPISPTLCKNFLDAMEKYHLKRTTMFTAYGLAEATLAVAFPALDKEYSVIYLNRDYLNQGETVQKISPADKKAVGFVIEA